MWCLSAWETPCEYVERIESGNAMKQRAIKKEFTTLLRKLLPQVVAKLLRNEAKYRFSGKWKHRDWEQGCQLGLRNHTDKGDPIDVIIYAFFCWYHKWPTGPVGSEWLTTANYTPLAPNGHTREYWAFDGAQVLVLHWANELDMFDSYEEQEEETCTGWLIDCGADGMKVYKAPAITHFMEYFIPQAPAT